MTSTERVRLWRAKKQREGYTVVTYLVHIDDRDKVKKYIETLTEKRKRDRYAKTTSTV